MEDITLLQGDCLELLKDVPTESVDFIFTDLPYNTTQNDWDCLIDLDKLWAEYKRVIKPHGCIALFAQSPFDKILACSNLKMYRYEWIIEKTKATGHLNAKKMPMKAHENILIFYKKLPTYHPQMTHGHTRKVSTAEHKKNCKVTTNYGNHGLTTYDSTDRYPRDVLKFSWDTQKSSIHPTQKPLALAEYMIKTYTNEGDVVLDSCMGSGTTGVACANLNRNFIGMELREDYYQAAKQRIGDILSDDNLLQKRLSCYHLINLIM